MSLLMRFDGYMENDSSLRQLIKFLKIHYYIGKKLTCPFYSYQKDNWEILADILNKFSNLVERIANYFPRQSNLDCLIWSFSSNGEIFTKAIFQEYLSFNSEQIWSRFIWKHFIPRKHSIHVQKVLHKCVAFGNNLKKHGFCFNQPMQTMCD